MYKSALLLALFAMFSQSVLAGPDSMSAIAVIDNGEGITGTIWFTQDSKDSGTKVHAEFMGLTQGDHGFHVHQFGNLTGGCNSTGLHYNPYNQTHGDVNSKPRHLGDIGNVVSPGPDSKTVLDVTVDVMPLTGPYSIIGRGIVVHADKDDLGQGGNAESLSNGNSGKRIACAIIGIAE
ncbi:Cu/Zn superoxide dismutase [Gongronella butleri]|nr:Cu/Zn superoxide dismutase [Gongronella butleri]